MNPPKPSFTACCGETAGEHHRLDRPRSTLEAFMSAMSCWRPAATDLPCRTSEPALRPGLAAQPAVPAISKQSEQQRASWFEHDLYGLSMIFRKAVTTPHQVRGSLFRIMPSTGTRRNDQPRLLESASSGLMPAGENVSLRPSPNGEGRRRESHTKSEGGRSLCAPRSSSENLTSVSHFKFVIAVRSRELDDAAAPHQFEPVPADCSGNGGGSNGPLKPPVKTLQSPFDRSVSE